MTKERLPLRRINLAIKNEPFFNLHVSTPMIFLPFNLGPALIDVNKSLQSKWMNANVEYREKLFCGYDGADACWLLRECVWPPPV